MGSERQSGAEMPGPGASNTLPERGSAEADLKLLAEALPHLVWTCRPDGTLDYINRQGSEFLGAAVHTLQGPFPCGAAVHPEDDPRARASWAQCLLNGEPLTLETRLRRVDGQYLWHLHRAQPIRDRQGRVSQWMGSSTNVHDVREANDRAAFLLAVSTELAGMGNPQELVCAAMFRLRERLGAALVALVELDENRGEAVMLRERAGEGTQVEIASLALEPFEPLEVRTGKPAMTVLRDVREDTDASSLYDAWFGLEGVGGVVSAPLLQSGMLAAVLSVVEDRPRHWSDSDIELVQRVGDIVWPAFERARADRAVEDALREVNLRKDEFLAMLGHELRNPLAPIRSAVQILRIHASGRPELEWARAVIDRQTRHLSRLVDDLLDVSRIARGQIALQLERVDVAEFIRHGMETSRPLIRSRKHRIHVRLPAAALAVEGDLTRLAQVIANLLNNAAKYTAERGDIWVEATREGAQAVVKVRDSGAGIAPTLLPRVFELFAQAERTLDRSQGGLGIGLTLVKLLVEMHGGTVEAKSAGLGAGAEFIVRLPSHEAAGEPAALPATDSHPPHDPASGSLASGTPLSPAVTASVGKVAGEGTTGAPQGDGAQSAHNRGGGTPPVHPGAMRILIVDDNVDAADSTAMLLSLEGFETHSVHSAEAALEAAVVMKPDVVLLDIGLPEMDGYDVARRLRSLSEERVPTIVAVTGYGQPSDRDRAAAAGFDEFLVKPVEPAVLNRLLRSLQAPGS